MTKAKKSVRRVLTPEQKRKRNIRIAIICVSVVVAIAVVCATIFGVGEVGRKANLEMIEALDYVGSDLTPTFDETTKHWTFVTDEEFVVLQLTDIHIGAGGFSVQKDNWALNAVAKLVQTVKPDLVVVTGDIAYPVPFQAGTLNNKKEAELFATLMEQLGVYWTLCFGNHDTEVYSLYDRKDIYKFYTEDDRWAHCMLYTEEGVDGYSNSIINVKNSKGIITQTIVTVDSHAYPDDGTIVSGLSGYYDNIHANQIEWYEEEITELNNANKAHFATLDDASKAQYLSTLGVDEATFMNSSMIKSSMFFHIPLREYKDAWVEYLDNGKKNTDRVEYVQGVENEGGDLVYCGHGEDEMFETICKLGSTQGVFCGHDHFNNFTVKYDGVHLTYGMSIDYLAYIGIAKKTEQRGGTIITFAQNGGMTIEQLRLSDIKD